MTILFLLRFFPYYGGGESVTLSLANEMAKRNNKVIILFLKRTNAPLELFIQNSIEQIDAQEQLRNNEIELLTGKDFSKYFDLLHETIAKNQVDIIINQWWPSKLVYRSNNNIAKIIKCHHSAIIVDSKRKEYFVRLLGNVIYQKILCKYLKIKYKKDIKYSDRFVVLGNAYIDDLRRLYGDKYSEKIECIPNPSKYRNLDINMGKKEKKALFVGRFSKEKRIEKIINIWNGLTKKGICKDWELSLVGDGNTYEDISKLVKELNCGNIVLYGPKEPLSFYEKSKVLLLTSEYEGFPLVIIEAKQNGCVPVVMNTFSNCKELITCNFDGIITDDNDYDYENRLSELITNESKIQFMAWNAISSSKKYSVDQIVDLWEEMFSKI